MTSVAFLLDENIPSSVLDAVRRSEPLLTVLHSGHEPGTPESGTLDPDILTFAEEHHLAVVTFDKRTMSIHEAAHRAAGHHTWGVFIFPNGNSLSPGRIAFELRMVWGASDAEEWIDRIENLPY